MSRNEKRKNANEFSSEQKMREIEVNGKKTNKNNTCAAHTRMFFFCCQIRTTSSGGHLWKRCGRDNNLSSSLLLLQPQRKKHTQTHISLVCLIRRGRSFQKPIIISTNGQNFSADYRLREKY